MYQRARQGCDDRLWFVLCAWSFIKGRASLPGYRVREAKDSETKQYGGSQMFDELKLPKDFRLREAGREDEPFLEHLFFASRPYLALIPMPPEFVDALVRQQYQIQRDSYRTRFPEIHHLLILRQDEAIGRLMLHYDSDAATLHLVDVALLPAWHNLGIGSAVLREVQQWVRRHGRALTLCVSADSPARHLYQRLGFSQVGASETDLHLAWYPQGCLDDSVTQSSIIIDGGDAHERSVRW